MFHVMNPIIVMSVYKNTMTSLITIETATEVCCTISDFLGSNSLRGYTIRIRTGDEECVVFDPKSGRDVFIPANHYIEIDMDSKSPTQDLFSGRIYHLLPDDEESIETNDVESLLVKCKEPGVAKVTGSNVVEFPTIDFDSDALVTKLPDCFGIYIRQLE